MAGTGVIKASIVTQKLTSSYLKVTYHEYDFCVLESHLCSLMCFVVQILLIDNEHSQLVTCGNVFQGTCQSRNLDNISLYKVHVVVRGSYQFVASTDPSHSAVAFVAPGPDNSVQLYVGTDDHPSPASLYIDRLYTCGVTRRYLNGSNIFKIPPPNQDGLLDVISLI